MKVCSVQECTNLRHSKGYCGKHYAAARRHGGDPLGGGPAPGFAQKFIEDVRQSNVDACITWPFARLATGYAVSRRRHGTHFVHRQICIDLNGFPEKKMEVAHSCGNGHLGCVNPKHLSWKTRSANQMDRVVHGTSNRGERQWNSQLSQDDVLRVVSQVNSGRSMRSISVELGVGPKTVSDIMCGKTWQWVTGIDPLRKRYNRGDETWNSKIKSDGVLKIVSQVNDGRTRTAIAEEMGVSVKAISDITCGHTWSWLTGIGRKNAY